MARWLLGASLLVVAVAALMVAPGYSAGGGLAVSHAAPTVAGAAPTLAASSRAVSSPSEKLVATALSTARADHIPLSEVLVPNVHSSASLSNGVVQPLYQASPAPMGLGYFGVEEHHGVNQGSVSYFPSIEGAVTLNSVNPFYLASSSPDIFTMQLNTVLTHVTVLGNSSDQYWIQNVPIYFAASQTLGIEDNIWNFSAPGAGMQVGTLHSAFGTLVPGVFYFDVGPTWHMPTPFTIRLYNNATLSNLRPTIYFNYSITAANGTVISGSFDKVEFNSAAHPVSPAPSPTFQVNGKQFNPIGLLNDAEIMLGGPGGGSTTSLFGIDGSMGLWTRSNHSAVYKPVPAGSSFGTDTGETSEGIAEWSNGGPHPLAMLGPGPSLLQPLWGLVGAHSGFVRVTVHLTPSNAFVFANQGGAFRPGIAGWAPVPATGIATYALPPATYTFRFLLADHDPATMTVSGTTTTTVALAADSAMGVYTPLWAWNNAQLAGISSAGAGTVKNPYVLDNNARGSLNPVFAEFNDFYYPVFPGIFLGNTNAYVTVTGMPDFPVAMTLPIEAAATAHFGTPLTNNLEEQYYNDTHVSVVNNAQITGWVFNGISFASSVELWNTSDSLIANNIFQVQSLGLIVSGGTNNVVWGNIFETATTTAVNPGSIQDGIGAQTGLEEFDNGDLIYNNAFVTAVTAQTPTFNLYTGAPQLVVDRWNVTPQSASHVRMVNGWSLSGSILGLSVQAGNYWGNYGSQQDPYGILPYNNGGAFNFPTGIAVGGDFAPILPFNLHRVIFTETGLPSGTSWTVKLNGIVETSNSTTITFWDPSGAYAYVVFPVTGFTATPSSGAAIVNHVHISVGITFT